MKERNEYIIKIKRHYTTHKTPNGVQFTATEFHTITFETTYSRIMFRIKNKPELMKFLKENILLS